MTIRVAVVALLAALGGAPLWADAVADAREVYIAGDYAAALAVLMPEAEAGHARAQNLVGASYQYGNGVPVDAVQARRWFEASAAQGYPPAMHNLGYLYEVGMDGLPPDLVQARAWYEQAAALDYPPSLGNLGGFYVNGLGGPVDLEEARRMVLRGVQLDDSNAIEWWAWMHATGTGVPQDMNIARQYYEIAALFGAQTAQNEFGGMLERGEGGPQDLPRAMDFYLRALAQGEAYAGINAAWMHFDHPDLFPDQVQGVAYCLWAVEHALPEDVQEYATACEEAAQDLTPDQRRVAEKRAGAM